MHIKRVATPQAERALPAPIRVLIRDRSPALGAVPMPSRGRCTTCATRGREPTSQARPDRCLSGRAALIDAGWDGGARADHKPFLFFFAGESSRGRLLLSEPGRLFVAAYRLVAAGRERVQRPESRDSGGFGRPDRLGGRLRVRAGRRTDSLGALPLVTMPSNLARQPEPQLRVRNAARGDLDALMELEHRASRPTALAPQPAAFSQIADRGGDRGGGGGRPSRRQCDRAVPAAVAGGAALFDRGRPRPQAWGGPDAARSRRGGRARPRLPRHSSRSARDHHAAISRYRKSGYRELGPRATTRTAATRCGFEKRLMPRSPALNAAPAYFTQTTEFTCGPACIMMALAWADRPVVQAGAGLRVPALARGHHHLHDLEGSGRLRALRPGGGARHGLEPEVYVSWQGPISSIPHGRRTSAASCR